MKLFSGKLHQPLLKNLTLLMISVAYHYAAAQPNTTINLDDYKSKKYEDRQLRSEKTTEGKLGFTKKTYQNTVTHYNYFFNANNRLKELIVNAKQTYKDDYSKPIGFYNYSLDATARNKAEIDSILYKCNAGVLLHDLRNDWVDDLYLLMGKAYLFRKNFDSAGYVFQYINYIYAPKDDGYDIPLGSNASNTNGQFTIATNEKRNLWKKLTVKPITRNESFIWQVRNMIETNKLAEAAGLIAILKIDPNFPERLKTDLYEQMAYLYYKQEIYDSAAKYIQLALPNAESKNETARWEYLAAQQYVMAGRQSQASKLFEKALNHTIDPYLEVYATLNIVDLSANDKQPDAIASKIQALTKMAKKDRYDRFRDIIYYAVALLELKKNNDQAAIKYLVNSTASSIDNPGQKQKSFLLLGDVCYKNELYKDAYRFYDSAKNTAAIPADIANSLEQKQKWLKQVVDNMNVVHRQDSLMALATLSEADRIAAVKKLYKQIRKEQGLKEDKDLAFGGGAGLATTNTNLFDLTANKSTDFYFTNNTLRTQGLRDFKIKWGARPNVDNWRRQAAIVGTANLNTLSVTDVDNFKNKTDADTAKATTPEGMLLNIPLTKEKKDAANDAIKKALYANGDIFQNDLEEYVAAIKCYEELIRRFPFPANDYNEQTLFRLYYCYNKTGQATKADSIKKVMNEQHPDGNLTYSLTDKNKQETFAATKRYEDIYNLFIEGKFEEATLAKQKADNAYGTGYWTPQLLYIESIYYVKQQKDSIAINRLKSLISQFPHSNLTEKANTMIDVLKRRREIETYLTNLSIENKDDITDKPVNLNDTKVVTQVPAPKKEIPVVNTPSAIVPNTKIEQTPVINNTTATDKGFVFNPADAHFVMLILNKVDEVFVTEARNAFNRFNRERYYNLNLGTNTSKLTGEKTLLLIGPFNNAGDAINYIDVARPLSKTRIISWLSSDKYLYSIISNANLDKLNVLKDTDTYTKFLKDIFPDKF
ncbi:MAG: hypothetical protein J0I09_12245 [Sphingobacteriia bacterium]|nr:hypothetical protein [Sphingobacteriia bacterium]